MTINSNEKLIFDSIAKHSEAVGEEMKQLAKKIVVKTESGTSNKIPLDYAIERGMEKSNSQISGWFEDGTETVNTEANNGGAGTADGARRGHHLKSQRHLQFQG